MATLQALGSSNGFYAGDLQTGGYLAMIPAFQSIWFADGRKRANGCFHKLNFKDDKLTGVAAGTFQAGETVTQAVSGAEGIFFQSVGNDHFVYRTDTTAFDTTHTITGATSGATVVPTAVAYPPQWTNWTTRVLSSPATATGTIDDSTNYLPLGGSNIGCLFSGRIFLNSIENPNQWHASRHRDPEDWRTAQPDVGSPVSSQTSKLGIVGDAITAMIPYMDHYMYFGCMDEIWIMRGDPGSGAQITNAARKVGMFGPDAYAYDEKGNMFFLGMDGFYVFPRGSGFNNDPPENLTKDKLPNLVSSLGLNRRTDRVVMGYDKDRYGVEIAITQFDGLYGTQFFWDLRLNALCPEVYGNADHYPASMLYYDSRVSSTRGLLMAGQDGYIRKWDDDQKSDDGSQAIDAYCSLGPFQSFPAMRRQGQLAELSARVAEDTDGVDISVYAGDAAEGVITDIKNAATPKASEQITGGGRLPVYRPKSTGAVFCVQMRNNTGGQRFALERVTAKIKDAGEVKGE